MGVVNFITGGCIGYVEGNERVARKVPFEYGVSGGPLKRLVGGSDYAIII